jgi:multidrug efflux pump
VPIDSTVRIYTELFPFAERARPLEDIIEELEEVTTGIPGVLTEITAIDQGPPIAKDIGVQISAENREQLKETALYVREKLASIEGVYEIEDSLPLPGVDWEMEVDRAEAGRLGLDVGRIGAALQFVTEGALVGQYRPLNVEEEVDIRVRYPSSSRDLTQLDSLRIQTPQGALPIGSVVKRVAKPRQDKIERRDLLPFYVIQGNTRKGYATNLQVEEMQKWFDEEASLPAGTEIKFLGQAEENAAAAQFGKNAAMAIMFMMGVILLLQFNSFYHVFLTLSAVVLSVFGVILGLVFYPYISMILIDTYQRLLSNGFAPEDAALRTAAQRLRPVILTTLTTVVGLMPLVLGWQANIFTGEFSTAGSSTSDIWAPISYVVSAGLGFATILTLIITPVMLAMPTVLWKRIKKLLGKNSRNELMSNDAMLDEDDVSPTPLSSAAE